MGCDIHLYVEKRENGKWVHAQHQVMDNKYGYMDVPYDKHLYRDRNYQLFAVLADVKNYDDRMIPITPPKGLPDDASDDIKALSDLEGLDGHSRSWHTLADLLTYDWTQIVTLHGWISGVECYHWLQWSKGEGESPASYSGGVGGPNIKYISQDEMERGIKELLGQIKRGMSWDAIEEDVRAKFKDTYCEAHWQQPTYKCCRAFLSDVIPQLLRLGRPEDVRIVFWFDN